MPHLELYFRVVCRGWECSHSIRSEILFRSWCSDFFSTFPKNIFSTIWKKSEKILVEEKSEKIWSKKMNRKKMDRKKCISKIYFFRFFFEYFFFFSDRRKIFLGKVEKKSEHQYRNKISLRIECEHSQPLQTTLKYSSRCGIAQKALNLGNGLGGHGICTNHMTSWGDLCWGTLNQCSIFFSLPFGQLVFTHFLCISHTFLCFFCGGRLKLIFLIFENIQVGDLSQWAT